MALINKSDIDKINQVFHELECANALNEINDSIIDTLVIQTHYLDSILQNQKVIIENEKLINDQLILDHSVEINHYDKELRRTKNEKIM